MYVPEGARRDLEFAESGPSALIALPTVTVRGFLNFRTTVDGTVIVFTPASEAPSVEPSRAQQEAGTPSTTRAPEPAQPNNIQDIGFSQNNQDPLLVKKTSGVSEKKEPNGIETLKDFNAVIPSSENVFLIKSKASATSVHTATNKPSKTEPSKTEPSVTPTSVAYSGTKSEQVTPTSSGGGGQYPTGLVTVLGGTTVEKGTTIIHETKVIGTYIDGKYAQILQSTSRVISGAKSSEKQKPVVSSTTTTAFSKTIQPTASSTKTPRVDRTSSANNAFIASRANREKSNQVASSTSTFPRTRTDNKPLSNNIRRGDDGITANTVLQSSFRVPNGAEPQRASSSVATQSLASVGLSTGRFVTKSERVRPTTTLETDNTLVNLNNARRNQTNSSARQRYILPRRQSQTVRLNRFKVKLTIRPEQIGAISEDDHPANKNHFDEHENEDHKPEASGGNNNNNNNNNFDPNNVVFQKATITSVITLHVGRRKSVRTITITTSVPRGSEPSDVDSNNIGLQRRLIDPTEAAANDALILATTPPNPLSGVPVVPNINFENGEEATPPLIISRNKRTDLITISRTYSTTEQVWRTSVVPYVDGDITTSHTVTENFIIRKIITAYKTMPPHDENADDSDIDPLPTLDSNQNYQTALLQGDLPLPPSPQQQLLQTLSPQQQQQRQINQLQQQQQVQQQQLFNLQASGNPYLQLANSGTMPLDQLGSNPLLSLSAALSQNPLAAVYLGLHQLNRQVTQYSTITKSSEYTTTETVYSTKVVRLYDGRQTRYRTLSEPISTTEKVVTSYTTTVEPYINTQALVQQQQLQQLIGNTQLVPSIQPLKTSTVTSSYTTVTTGTSYSTKIYTLIYNAFSTKYRTVTSTSTFPTTIATYSTSEFVVRTPVSVAPALPIIPQQPVQVQPPVLAPQPPPAPVPVPVPAPVVPVVIPTTEQPLPLPIPVPIPVPGEE